MKSPKKKHQKSKPRKTLAQAIRKINSLQGKIDDLRYELRTEKELNTHDQDLRKREAERLLENVKTAYNVGEDLRKIVERLEREKKLVWDSLHKASEQINPMRDLLEFCVKCLDDFKNRHLVVCHQCDSDQFRFKNISIATDFERLLAKLAPYRQKKTSLDFVRMPADDNYVLPPDKE